jgi:hypothetical protein
MAGQGGASGTTPAALSAGGHAIRRRPAIAGADFVVQPGLDHRIERTITTLAATERASPNVTPRPH